MVIVSQMDGTIGEEQVEIEEKRIGEGEKSTSFQFVIRKNIIVIGKQSTPL